MHPLHLLAQETASRPEGAAGGAALIVGMICFTLLMSLLPGVIAFARGHPNAPAILVLTLLLGWTCIGWIIGLIWSFTNPPGSTTVIVERERGRRRRRDDDYDD